MNSFIGQLEQAFISPFVSNSGAVSLGAKLSSLEAEQFGVFSASDYSAGEPTSLASPSFKTNKRLIIKTGVPFSSGQLSPALSRHTKKAKATIEFEADDIISWIGQKADTSQAKTQKIAIGYDGVDASRTLNGLLDVKPLHVNLILQGEPIKRFFGKNRVVHRFVIDKGLCPSDCSAVDTCGNVPCDVIADAIIEKVNSEMLFSEVGGKLVQVPLKNFISASKIKKCTVDALTPTLTEYKKYQIEIQDDGVSTISKLAEAYPNVKITRDSHLDGYSVYSFWQLGSASAPADFSMSRYTFPICDTCPTCPTSSTVVNGVKIVQVKVPYGDTLPTITGVISSAKLGSSIDLGDTYLVKVATTASDTTIGSELAGVSEYSIIGIEGKQCLVGTTTKAWSTCETCNKTVKQFRITLPDKECGLGDRLADLQAAYPDLTVALQTQTSISKKSSVITFTGTSGTATVTIGGVARTATFATSLAVTRNNFITTHAAAYAAAGITITASGTADILAVGGATLATPTVVNATTNLAGTATTPAFITNETVRSECAASYVTEITSDCVAPEDCGLEERYSFGKPTSYMGYQWEEFAAITNYPNCDVPTVPTEPCCSCGVVFETAVWNKTFTDCTTVGYTNWHPNEVKPVLLQVNIHSLDYSNNPCDETKHYSTVLQRLSFNLGVSGEYVQEAEMAALRSYEGKKWSNNPFVNEVNGFQPIAKRHLMYDVYTLRLKHRGDDSDKYILKGQQYTDYKFFIAQGQGRTFETLINKLILSTGREDLKAVVL
jgi:hypothetical protein